MNSNLKTTVSTVGGISSARADNTMSSYRTQVQSRYKITKILEDVMESAIEPSQWREECERVEKQLIYPLKPQGNNKEETQLDDFYNRQEQVLGHLKVIKEFTVGPGPVLIDGLSESLKKELKQIKKKETKINTQNNEQISLIKASQERRKSLVQDLKKLANSN